MLDLNRTKRLFTITAGILVFGLIGTHSWVLDTLGYDLKASFIDKPAQVLVDQDACSSDHTMRDLIDELSTLSVQLTVHEERDGVIISDPIEGLIKELQLVYVYDLCTDFADLSEEQQLLFIEIEKLLFDLKGLNVKAKHLGIEAKILTIA